MPAFLSHSSKDKEFVSAVAAAMNPLEYEFDEQTFEYTMNVQAIRNALKRSDIVVFFLSKNSVSSTFVREEQRQAFEAVGRGTVKKVLVFTLDGTSYKELPDWLQEINVIQKITNPKLCARRIQASLLEARLSEEPEDLYLGRESDEAVLRKALSAPADETPIALHAVGFHGIGRRTLLRKTLNRLFPRLYSTFPLTTVSANEGIADLFRSLSRLTKFSSTYEQLEELQSFSIAEYPKQVALVSALIEGMTETGELLLVFDEGNGVLDDAGAYFPYWQDVIAELSHLRRPAIAFIQTRMQPYRLRHANELSFHQKVDALSIEASRELIAFSLKRSNTEFTEKQVDAVADLAGGHPFNIRFAIGLAQSYGIANFLRDPQTFIAWRDRRGEEFLADVTFSSLEEEIVSLIINYRLLSAEAIITLVNQSVSDIKEALRNLQDFCCVEHRDGLFHLANPIREAARRDRRFERSAQWHQEVSRKIIDGLAEYGTNEDVPLNLIDAASLAMVREGAAPEHLRFLVLPSHLLIVAREEYDAGRRAKCIELSKQAFEYKSSMTNDAQVEALRLWALSAARLSDNFEYEAARAALKTYKNPTGSRTLNFVEGLKARIDGREDDAERFFKAAHALSPANSSINRELAKIYLRQGLYVEAETYARSAYKTSPTNPFILDIMLDMLLGKRAQGMAVDATEIDQVTQKLEEYGNEPGYSFHSVRQAQKLINAKKYNDAVRVADDAINRTPELAAPYFIKIEALLRQAGKTTEAERTLGHVSSLLYDKGFSEGEASSIAEYELRIHIEKKDYGAAKDKLEGGLKIAHRVRERLLRQLARAIAFEPGTASKSLQGWAKEAIR